MPETTRRDATDPGGPTGRLATWLAGSDLAEETQAALRPLGIQVVASSPQQYQSFLLEETTRRSEMARFASVVPE
jgi:hypothetical protein